MKTYQRHDRRVTGNVIVAGKQANASLINSAGRCPMHSVVSFYFFILGAGDSRKHQISNQTMFTAHKKAELLPL